MERFWNGETLLTVEQVSCVRESVADRARELAERTRSSLEVRRGRPL
jgi:hypothetical protein